MILVAKYPAWKVKGNEYSLFVKFDYNQVLVDKVKTLPIRYYEPNNKVWEVPISDIDRVVNLFGKENISIFNDFPEFEAYLMSLEIKKTGKKSIDELLEYYENLRPLVDYDFKTVPDGHQVECFNLALERDNLLITDSMGLGKSKEAIDICDYRKSKGLAKHTLIVCGLNGLKYNWQDIEIPTHSYNNSQVVDGTAKQRLEKLLDYWKYFYTIINIETLRSNEKIDKKTKEIIKPNTNKVFDTAVHLCNAGKFEIVLVDEFHKANNHTSRQGAGLRFLNSKYKIALSGTPLTKKIERAWSILNWMGLESSSYWNFRNRYCIHGGYTGWDVVGYKNLDELHERFDRYQIRRPKGILKLPPKVYEVVYIEMTPKERMEYRQIKSGIIYDAEKEDVKLIDPKHAMIPLRQFTDKVKIRALKDKVDELKDNDEPCVIYSMYKEGLYILEEALREERPLVVSGDEKSTKRRQELVNDFQDGMSNVIMGTPQVLGTGYTLTRSQYVLFLNKLWVCTDNDQAEDRCHRRGTTGSVTVLSFIVKNSVDERVEDILAYDRKYIDKVVDGVPIWKKSNKDLFNFLLMED